MAKVLDSGLVVWEFKLQSSYYFRFQTNPLGKRKKPFPPPQLWIKEEEKN